MLNLKVFYLFAFLFCGVCFCNANAHDGVVSISGTIEDNTCEISSESQDKFVYMGVVPVKEFTIAGTRSNAIPFIINLKNCGPAASEVSITFSGEVNSLNADYFSVDSETESSKGIALGIYDDKDVLIPPNKKSNGYLIHPEQDSIDLNFSARYISVSNVVSGGSANVIATFVLNYS